MEPLPDHIGKTNRRRLFDLINLVSERFGYIAQLIESIAPPVVHFANCVMCIVFIFISFQNIVRERLRRNANMEAIRAFDHTDRK